MKHRSGHRIDRVSSYRGRYFRTIGKIFNENRKLVPKKFLLGTVVVVA